MALEGNQLETALDLLQSLQPSIAVLLQGRNSVNVRLNSLDILKPDRDRKNAHVLFSGPSTLDDDEGARLTAVCSKYYRLPSQTRANHTPGLVNKTFINAGFITEKRPLKARHRSLVTYSWLIATSYIALF